MLIGMFTFQDGHHRTGVVLALLGAAWLIQRIYWLTHQDPP